MQTETIQRIVERGEIRLAVEYKDPYSTGFPPEMYIDKETGEPWGVGPILLNLIASDLGITPVNVDMPWSTHRDALQAGEVDIILGTNTPERALRVAFTDGRLMANRVVCLSHKQSDFHMPDVLESSITIACWKGSSVVQVAEAHFPNADIVEYSKPEDEVNAGRADLYVNDSITHRFLELNPALRILENSVLSKEYVHFAVRQDADDLRKWLNNWYRYHDAQGTIDRWCHDWWESFMAC